MKQFSIGLVFFLAGALFLSASGMVENIQIDRFDYSEIKELRVDGKLFSVTVNGSTGNSVSGIVKAPNGNEFKVKSKQEGDVLLVWCEKYPMFNTGNPEIILTVPSSVKVTVTTSSGSIDVSNLKGRDLKLESTSGSIAAYECENNLKCNATSGNIKIKGVLGDKELIATSGSIFVENSLGGVTADSSSGSIFFDTIIGDIDASSTSGFIKIESAEGIFDITTTSGRIEGLKVLAVGNSGFKTSSGSIDIDFADPLSEYSFDLSAGSGSVKVGTHSGNGSMFIEGGEIHIKGTTESGSQNYQ